MTDISILDQHIAILERAADALKQLRRGITPPDVTVAEAFASSSLAVRILNSLAGHKNHWNNGQWAPAMLSEVAELTRAELLRLPNFGNKCYREVWRVCVDRGFWKRDDPYRPSPREAAA